MKEFGSSDYALMYIDTNGIQKPNAAGRDFFGKIRLYSDGKIMGVRYENADVDSCPTFAEDDSEKQFATSCFVKIQQEGWEMNY